MNLIIIIYLYICGTRHIYIYYIYDIYLYIWHFGGLGVLYQQCHNRIIEVDSN